MGLFKFLKANKAPPVTAIIGVYTISKSQEAKLIEITVDCPPSQLHIGKITQPDDNTRASNWQVAYDEHYLNVDGTAVIGRFGEVPIDAPSTRLAFFLYFVNFDKPILTQFGKIQLPKETPIPNRLEKIISFEPVN